MLLQFSYQFVVIVDFMQSNNHVHTRGHFHVKLDADLVLGKHATISVTVLKLEGKAKLAVRLLFRAFLWQMMQWMLICSSATPRRLTTGSRSSTIQCCNSRLVTSFAQYGEL